MAAAADIIVIERVAGGAIDPGRLRRGAALAGKIEAGAARSRSKPLAQELRRRVVGAGNHRRNRIDKAGAGDLDRLLRQPLESQARDKAPEFLGQRHRILRSEFPGLWSNRGPAATRGELVTAPILRDEDA